MLEAARRVVSRRFVRLALVVGIPLVVAPMLFARRVTAKRSSPVSKSVTRPDVAATLLGRLQVLIDEARGRLGIPQAVVPTLVPHNPLVVSVERSRDREGAFSIVVEEAFASALSDDELQAMVAHELGHVWIFTHHPFLHTEELANQVALRVVRRETLEAVYEKVWKRTGARGTLAYLPKP